jgi:tetraacyldisaccharide 4'-kinase
LFNPSQFRDLVSGRRRGAVATMLRAGLRLAEAPYTWIVRRRNRRYDTGAAAVHRVGVPVVSVGNLTLGGTGKTPMVEWLARWFVRHGVRVGVVSRGYGAQAGMSNDEARELAAKLPDVHHVQDPDRVAGALRAIEQFRCQVLVLDDAFQHRRIGRDLDVVLLDALEPFGFDHVFPRGTLREPLEGLRRAGVVALSRADALPPAQREEVRRQIERLAPRAAWLETVHAARVLVSCSGAQVPLESLRGKPIAAFCGVGNPAGFRHTLDTCGYRVAGWREFPDHHAYPPHNVAALAAWADGLQADAVLCTQKDLVKLGVERLGQRPLWAVGIELDVLAGREALERHLTALLP